MEVMMAGAGWLMMASDDVAHPPSHNSRVEDEEEENKLHRLRISLYSPRSGRRRDGEIFRPALLLMLYPMVGDLVGVRPGHREAVNHHFRRRANEYTQDAGSCCKTKQIANIVGIQNNDNGTLANTAQHNCRSLAERDEPKIRASEPLGAQYLKLHNPTGGLIPTPSALLANHSLFRLPGMMFPRVTVNNGRIFRSISKHHPAGASERGLMPDGRLAYDIDLGICCDYRGNGLHFVQPIIRFGPLPFQHHRSPPSTE
ncbi:unnamed protein product [Diplocarpon coronariae]